MEKSFGSKSVAPLAGAGFASLRTFVVEDHAFQRAGLITMLRSLGIVQIEEASNGREALALLDRGELADVLLCDLEMPEMDGIELLSEVAARQLARGVIIISGREPEILAGVEAMARASGLHVLGQLKKPPTVEALRELLEHEPPRKTAARGDRRSPALDAARLRRALEANEFQADFQPKVSLSTGKLLGVEALARWRPPDASPVGPDVFIPALVGSELITPLTEQILELGCRALVEWERAGIKTGIAVNLSMKTLADVKTVSRLIKRVQAHGLAPRRITFEVTETEIMEDTAKVLNVLTRLRLHGFGLAIDDFGTGYSSLSQLNTIPFTELKIDRTFVRHCESSPRLKLIIASSIELARRMQIRTVAEGVETEREWDFLSQSNCDEAQGYFIARPMPAAEMPAWLGRRQGPDPGGAAGARA